MKHYSSSPRCTKKKQKYKTPEELTSAPQTFFFRRSGPKGTCCTHQSVYVVPRSAVRKPTPHPHIPHISNLNQPSNVKNIAFTPSFLPVKSLGAPVPWALPPRPELFPNLVVPPGSTATNACAVFQFQRRWGFLFNFYFFRFSFLFPFDSVTSFSFPPFIFYARSSKKPPNFIVLPTGSLHTPYHLTYSTAVRQTAHPPCENTQASFKRGRANHPGGFSNRKLEFFTLQHPVRSESTVH